MSEFWLTVGWCAIVVLFAISAFFSSSETAIMGVNRLRLRSLIEKRDRKAMKVDSLLSNPGRLLSGILLGNNFANVLLASLSTAIAVALWGDFAPLYVSPILTLLLLIFAEIIPKTLAAQRSMSMARGVAMPLDFFIRLTSPLTWVTSRISRAFLAPFSLSEETENEGVAPEDLVAMAQVGAEAGTLGHMTQNILHGAYEFSVTSIRDVMVPRHEMVCLSLSTGVDGFVEKISSVGHTRFPVYGESEEDIIGTLHAKDLLHRPGRPSEIEKLEDIIRPAVFVPESTNLGRALSLMQESKGEMIFVVDEYGGIEGLVTLKDLMEELVGEIEDEHDNSRKRRVDVIRPGSLISDATVTLRYLHRKSGLDLTARTARTVGGLLVELAPGDLRLGKQVEFDGYRLTILAMNGRFLSKIRIDWEPSAEDDDENDENDD
ncbi:MAG: putative hemolysin [Planctomycetota bacterium]|jgi:putative hemolysin